MGGARFFFTFLAVCFILAACQQSRLDQGASPMLAEDGTRFDFEAFTQQRMIVMLIDQNEKAPCDCSEVLANVAGMADRYPDITLATVYFSREKTQSGNSNGLKNYQFGNTYFDLDRAFLREYSVIDEATLLYLDRLGKLVFMHPVEINTLQNQTIQQVLTMM